MSRIQVDPKLFVTCRLCLDDTGQYQIVPTVQEQIKFCFDILVSKIEIIVRLDRSSFIRSTIRYVLILTIPCYLDFINSEYNNYRILSCLHCILVLLHYLIELFLPILIVKK